MRQCRLRKYNRYQIAWIPAKFAVKGKYIRLHDDDGWLVESEFTIGVATGMAWKSLEKEILKCELLCSICHRLEHASRETNPRFMAEIERLLRKVADRVIAPD